MKSQTNLLAQDTQKVLKILHIFQDYTEQTKIAVKVEDFLLSLLQAGEGRLAFQLSSYLLTHQIDVPISTKTRDAAFNSILSPCWTQVFLNIIQLWIKNLWRDKPKDFHNTCRLWENQVKFLVGAIIQSICAELPSQELVPKISHFASKTNGDAATLVKYIQVASEDPLKKIELIRTLILSYLSVGMASHDLTALAKIPGKQSVVEVPQHCKDLICSVFGFMDRLTNSDKYILANEQAKVKVVEICINAFLMMLKYQLHPYLKNAQDLENFTGIIYRGLTKILKNVNYSLTSPYTVDVLFLRSNLKQLEPFWADKDPQKFRFSTIFNDFIQKQSQGQPETSQTITQSTTSNKLNKDRHTYSMSYPCFKPSYRQQDPDLHDEFVKLINMQSWRPASGSRKQKIRKSFIHLTQQMRARLLCQGLNERGLPKEIIDDMQDILNIGAEDRYLLTLEPYWCKVCFKFSLQLHCRGCLRLVSLNAPFLHSLNTQEAQI